MIFPHFFRYSGSLYVAALIFQQLSITYNRLSTIGFQPIDEIVSWFTKTLTDETDEKRIVRVTCFGLYL